MAAFTAKIAPMQPVMFDALLEEGSRRTPEGRHRIKRGRFSACLLPT
jgi:hypothetical protein